MSKRKPIGKRKRFAVLSRDSFTCQYCGASAPNVMLHVDHVVPVSKGGRDDIGNLVTACFSCNVGKSDTPFGDGAGFSEPHSKFMMPADECLPARNRPEAWWFAESGFALTEFERGIIAMAARRHGDDHVVRAMICAVDACGKHAEVPSGIHRDMRAAISMVPAAAWAAEMESANHA